MLNKMQRIKYFDDYVYNCFINFKVFEKKRPILCTHTHTLPTCGLNFRGKLYRKFVKYIFFLSIY